MGKIESKKKLAAHLEKTRGTPVEKHWVRAMFPKE